MDKFFEFHANNIPAQYPVWKQQTVPCLEIPGQRCYGHIRPIGYQGIRRIVQCRYTVFQLFDIVLMVCPVAVKLNQLLYRFFVVIGDEKKIPDIIKKPALHFQHFNGLTKYDHSVRLLALPRPVLEFSDMFTFGFKILIFTPFDHLIKGVYPHLPL